MKTPVNNSDQVSLTTKQLLRQLLELQSELQHYRRDHFMYNQDDATLKVIQSIDLLIEQLIEWKINCDRLLVHLFQ